MIMLELSVNAVYLKHVLERFEQSLQSDSDFYGLKYFYLMNSWKIDVWNLLRIVEFLC